MGLLRLRGFLGGRTEGAIMDLPWDLAVLAAPHPPNLDHPLLVPRESPIWTVRFLMHRVNHKILGQGRWVWADKGGIHQDKPQRVGGDCRGLVVATGVAREEEGGSGPPFRQGGEDV